MTDLIRKSDALDLLCKFCGIAEDVEKCRKTSADGWCKEYCELKNMPTVEAEPVRHGHWIDVTDLDSPDYEFACSECYYRNFERVMDAVAWNYCPNCGAKMDERKEEWVT